MDNTSSPTTAYTSEIRDKLKADRTAVTPAGSFSKKAKEDGGYNSQHQCEGISQHGGRKGTGTTAAGTSFTPDPKTHIKAAVQCVSGGISSGIAMVFVYPLDTAKTKMQTFGHLYRSGYHSLLVEWRAGGTRAVYRGLTPATLGSVAESCAYFMWYGVWQDVVRSLARAERTEHMTPLQNTAAGQLTGMSISVMMTPVELVKCRLQALREVSRQDSGRSYRPSTRPFRLFLQIRKEDGFRGLYSGFTGVFTKMVLGFGAMFGTYDLFRTHFVKEGMRKDQIGHTAQMVSGAAAGLAYWSVAYPLDLVKVRMQIDPETGKSQNFFNLSYRVLRSEGVMAMYRGFNLTAMRAVIAFSITFTLYEHLRTKLLSLCS